METWQIILAIIIVGLSIIMPIYYSYKRINEKRKLEQELKEGREVSEREKLGGKIDQIYWVLLTVAGTAVVFVLERMFN